jgi:hypothetical protein
MLEEGIGCEKWVGMRQDDHALGNSASEFLPVLQ